MEAGAGFEPAWVRFAVRRLSLSSQPALMVGMEGFEPSTCSDFKSDDSAYWTTFP